MQGSIKNLKPSFGFIRGDDRIDRFFLPGSMTQPVAREFADLRQGDRVEFEHQDHERGPRAVRVVVLASSSSEMAA
jgi:cold shock CspA family protein